MTTRSTALRRLALLLTLALIAHLPARAQDSGPRAAPAQAAASSQAASPQASPPQAASPQAASPQATPSRTTPSQTQASRPAAARAAPSQAAPSSAPSAASPTAAYSGPAYDIEIVIFRTRAALGQPENWTAETTAGGTVAGGEASSGSASVGKLLTVLPSSAYRLTAIASRLRSSGTYEPVAHAAWVQTASAWGTHTGFSLDSLGIEVPGLTGVIFLERGEFLHLGMALSYTMQDPPSGLNAPPGTTFVMNETRRVRFYQRNYYDHPAFGAIALVTPARGPRPPGR